MKQKTERKRTFGGREGGREGWRAENNRNTRKTV
jgi:hypothetical protein